MAPKTHSRTLKKLPKNSVYTGKLAKGCKHCGKGAKMVLLVTGKCRRRCLYCPLSDEKKGRDVIYANEKLVEKDADILGEAALINALGTGITGGDPMAAPARTLKYIKLLKSQFGPGHHIHLYTAAAFAKKYLKHLARAGLDEIRFHPPFRSWVKLSPEFKDLLSEALKCGLDVGVEIPVLPEYKAEILKLANELEIIGVHFLNLNELEYSTTNFEALNARGYTVKNDISSAVKGSESLAKAIIKKLSDKKFKMALHYCSSSYKDAIQLRNRIMRRAKNIAKKYHIITKDGTLLKGIIELADTSKLSKSQILRQLRSLKDALGQEFQVPNSLMGIDEEKSRLEIAPWVLEEIASEIDDGKYNCFIIEEYPTADRLEVERSPI
jgi:pyruvate formate-lyase activating enzyme-like uncharacterized protein